MTLHYAYVSKAAKNNIPTKFSDTFPVDQLIDQLFLWIRTIPSDTSFN